MVDLVLEIERGWTIVENKHPGCLSFGPIPVESKQIQKNYRAT